MQSKWQITTLLRCLRWEEGNIFLKTKRSLLLLSRSVCYMPVWAALNSGCSSATNSELHVDCTTCTLRRGGARAHLPVEPNGGCSLLPSSSPLRPGMFHQHTHYVISVDNSTFIDSLDHFFSSSEVSVFFVKVQAFVLQLSVHELDFFLVLFVSYWYS